MKRYFPFVILVIMAFSCSVGNEPDKNTKCIASNNPAIRYDGRFEETAESAKYLYPGSTISMNFTGTTLRAKFDKTLSYYWVQIDENEPYRLCSLSEERLVADNTFLLAQNLKNGEHSVKIVMISEGVHRNPAFKGFIVDKNAEISRPDDKAVKFEFIGNSMTCGYGSEVPNGVPYDDSTSNFCHSYAYQTAQAFNADYMIVARSGIGIYRNYGDVETASEYGSMVNNYQNTWLQSSHKWDFGKFTPDVVFVNLGTNDTWQMESFNKDVFTAEFRRLLNMVSTQYPKAKIVLLAGSMMAGEALSVVPPILDDLQREFNSTERPVYRFNFTPITGEGADWHPSTAQQTAMAKELIVFLRENKVVN